MSPRHRTSLLTACQYLILLLSTTCTLFATFTNAQGSPEVTVTGFQNIPDRLFFFDDTTSVIYHDPYAGTVFVSGDEGKTWAEATDIPKGAATMIINHPFDNNYAFVLTRSKTHYRTDDRGRSWRPFTMPVDPAGIASPLSFHSDPAKYGYILYQGTKCEMNGWLPFCWDETYYTKEAFTDDPKPLLSDTAYCQFAHSTKDFKHEAPDDLIYCTAFDSTASSPFGHSLSSSRVFSSTDFFMGDNQVVDFGIGAKNARGVIALAIYGRFAVVVLKDLTEGAAGGVHLYVTTDTKTWAKAAFPHASTARLKEDAYTIVESMTHSLAVDLLLQSHRNIGSLYTSNSNGTFFVESLPDTNRNDRGYVDYEGVYGVEGVGLANVVLNAGEVESSKGRVAKQLRTKITFDAGATWEDVRPPATDASGNTIPCSQSDPEQCALHLHSVTDSRNWGRVFSSPAPGLLMAVGSIGRFLKPYSECDTFLSTDAGATWAMVLRGTWKYEFGDSGSVMVAVSDSGETSGVKYSLDFGRTWQDYDIGYTFIAGALFTVPDSTSQKFIILAQLSPDDRGKVGGQAYATLFLDFLPTRSRKCDEGDMEKWYARTSKGTECVMGHKQWYWRRKQNADCYVGDKFQDPVEHEETCPCTDEDFECDYNFVRSQGECIAVGPEPIPAGVCTGDPNQIYKGSSGYRRIPGNTCTGGVTKDDKVDRPCSQAAPPEGEVVHQTFEFPGEAVQWAYFKESTTILVLLSDGTMWQSRNEGYSWDQIQPEKRFVRFYHHAFANDRAYLITQGREYYYTTDTARSWHVGEAPTPPNTFGAVILHFHPVNAEYLLWVGNAGCEDKGENCRGEAQYSRDNGRHWTAIESYVRNCAWARDTQLRIDQTEILCESYRDKKGDQRRFGMRNPLELVGGTDYFRKKTKFFDNVVGFTKFSEYLIVAEYAKGKAGLDIQVSLDGRTFATGLFPPDMSPENHAYTVLESSTDSVFLHLTTQEMMGLYWGSILKSNSNGTYYGSSIDHVNRNGQGFVDFEKLIGLDGIAVVNIVSNPDTAFVTGKKELQTRITHNDGGTWKPMRPPPTDSKGQKYECDSTSCGLHIHGYTERYDARATYSSPSVVGLMMAVGNVGQKLAPYTESDTFLSRDAGFTWEEVHKDAHVWEFGDSGSILVMANDEVPTDVVLFSTDEGMSWREYSFGEKVRVKEIMTVPSDTSRKFILMGTHSTSKKTVAVHIDFSSLTTVHCQLSTEDPGHDDFELWSPSEERTETCLFGRQTLYHRRRREKNCVVGTQPKAAEKIVKNCACTDVDFECEFNHIRDSSGDCVLVAGAQPRPDDPDEECRNGEEYWYERTAYRKIPHSSCEDGLRPDRGTAHACPGLSGHSSWFWLFVLFIPFAFTALIAYSYYRRSGLARGRIRLPGEIGPHAFQSDSKIMDTIASVPYFVVGVVGIAWEYVASLNILPLGFRSRRGYRDVPVDADAQVLRFEDDD